MNTTLILVIASILIMFLIFPLLFFLRRRVELSLDGDILVLNYPVSDKKIDLERELLNWEVEQAYYIRWGIFHAIKMRFKNGKQLAVNSLFNQSNYDLLFSHLNSKFKDRRKA